MVRENMRSPRAVFQHLYFVRTTLQGGFLLGFDSRPRTDPQRCHSTFLSPFTKENRFISVRRAPQSFEPPPSRRDPPSDLHRWFSGKINGCQSASSLNGALVYASSVSPGFDSRTMHRHMQARHFGSPPLGFAPRLATSTATLRRQHRIPSDLRS